MRAMLATMVCAVSFATAAWRGTPARASALPFYVDSTVTPVWTADTARLHRVNAFHLVDQDGRRVDDRAFDGRVTVVTFFYASCKDLCPRLESKLAAVRAAHGSDPRVQIVSISVAPGHDTAPVLAAYAAANHISAPAWRLLTGEPAEVARVARESFFADAPAVRAAGATHGETIWLIDSQRRIRGLYNGTMPLDTKRLVEDIATLTHAHGG
jgi:protein SCO1/2